MNSAQRRMILARDSYTCCICLVSFFPGTYHRREPLLHPLSALSVDHVHSRRIVHGLKMDEGWENLLTLCGACHWQKDNAGISSQIQHVWGLIMNPQTGLTRRRSLLLVLGLLVQDVSFTELASTLAASYLGKESNAYLAAYEDERARILVKRMKHSRWDTLPA